MTPIPTKAILVVEDDDTLRQLTIQSLEGEHYWVFSARNVEEAWSLFNEHWLLMDLIMTEVVLPDTDALELTARVRALNPDLSSVNYFGLLATIILAGSGATWTGVESMVMA